MPLPQRLFLVFILFAAMLAGFATWQLPKLTFNNDILALFPEAEPHSNETLALKHASQIYNEFASKPVLFLVGHTTPETAQSAASFFATQLSNYGHVITDVQLESSADSAQAFMQLYASHSATLMSDTDKQLLRTSPDQFTQKKLRALYTQPSLMQADVFLNDPFSTGSQFLETNLNAISTNFRPNNGTMQIEHAKKTWVLIQAKIVGSSFSLNTQQEFFSALSQTKLELSTKFTHLEFKQEGAIFFARSGTRQAQSEISTVGLGSVIGIIALLLFAFRSLGALCFSLVPTAVGIFSGLVICQWAFGQVHMIAMIFGASLIGVSIDYSFHFLSARQAEGNDWNATEGIRRLRWGLGLGVITSASAYLSFIFSGFPGFQQIAVFSATGLIAACLTVSTLFPILFRHASVPTPGMQYALRILTKWAECIGKLRGNSLSRLIPVSAVLIIMISLAISTAHFSDDIRRMQSPNEDVLAAHKEFSALSGQNIARPFILVGADSVQTLLQKLEYTDTELHSMGIVSHHLADWVPSQQRQSENRRILQSHLSANDLDTQFFNRIQLSQDAQQHFSTALNKNHYLTLETVLPLLRSLIERPWMFDLNERHYAFVALESPLDEPRIANWAKNQEDIDWVDQVTQTNTLLKTYREKSIKTFVYAVGIVFVLLCLRYRPLNALLVISPPVLSCLIAVATLALFQVSLSLFNIMALVLVLGIGIDFSVFVRESGSHTSVCLFAILLSTITTILSFGLLSLSTTDAIASFGITVLVGISACFFLSPIAKLELKHIRPAKASDIK